MPEKEAAAKPEGEAAVSKEVPAAAAPAAAAGAPPTAPIVYALALPDKSPLDVKAVERFTELAKANQWTPETAQAVLARTNDEVAETLTVLEAANKPGGSMYETRVKGWAQDALSAYDLGNGNLERLKAAVVDAELELAKAPPAIREFLVNSGYGSHPDFIRWLRDVHGRTKEKPMASGDAGAPPPKERSYADRMYAPNESVGAPT